MRLGQLDAARATFTRAMEGYVHLQGRRGRAVGDILWHLGDVARRQGDPEAAHNLYSDGLAILRRQPGPEDPDTLDLIGHDAEAMLELGRLVAARNLLRSVVEGYRRTLGEDNALTERAQRRLDAISPRRKSRARE